MFERARLEEFAPGEGIRVGAFQERFDEEGWIPIPVPGDVHRALLDAGRIEDPFYDRNEEKCAWIEDREWWYRMTFDGPQEPLRPGERLRLVFQGLDTFATIWLNGEELGGHSNMFCEAVFDVGALVRPGENTLALRFDRPLDHVGEELPDQWGRNPERVFMRTRWDADRASGALDRYLSVSSDHDRFRSNRYFFGAIKDLRRDPFKPKVDITPIGAHELSVRLEAPAYTYFVHLEVPDEATLFSDNYFDIEPEQQRTISITNKQKALEPENIKVRWR